jgi:hypothetical protein
MHVVLPIISVEPANSQGRHTVAFGRCQIGPVNLRRFAEKQTFVVSQVTSRSRRLPFDEGDRDDGSFCTDEIVVAENLRGSFEHVIRSLMSGGK